MTSCPIFLLVFCLVCWSVTFTCIPLSTLHSPLCPPSITQTMPIYELVRLSTAADHVGERLANLRTAWDEYLLEFNSCQCAPCKHNGIPVLMGTSCQCICKSGYRGAACEDTLRQGEILAIICSHMKIQYKCCPVNNLCYSLNITCL